MGFDFQFLNYSSMNTEPGQTGMNCHKDTKTQSKTFG